MSIATVQRQASAAEMAAEIDRRGAVIESLEAEVESLRRANRHLGDQAAANRSKIAYLTSAEQRERNAWHQRDKALKRAEEAEGKAERAYGAGFRDAMAMAASVVRNWSLPTIQTPSMWLIDKAGIEADILAIELPARNGE
ncbi:hypothetical protein CHELA1G11_11211 [Hyphomicrobiales bacterium]|nr:hypothetical protein CHELA1G11_11211 [Hyphomicrobiales bacterium]CAH1669353.1 hypothetical protein CHELA1G2_13098 [Hyphomicrobiales bacterium]